MPLGQHVQILSSRIASDCLRCSQELTGHLTAAAALVPSRANAAAAQIWSAAAAKLMQQSDASRVQHLTALQQCEEQVEQTVQQAYQKLEQQVNRFMLNAWVTLSKCTKVDLLLKPVRWSEAVIQNLFGVHTSHAL